MRKTKMTRSRRRRWNGCGVQISGFGFVEWKYIVGAVVFALSMMAVARLLCLLIAWWRFGW